MFGNDDILQIEYSCKYKVTKYVSYFLRLSEYLRV